MIAIAIILGVLLVASEVHNILLRRWNATQATNLTRLVSDNAVLIDTIEDHEDTIAEKEDTIRLGNKTADNYRRMLRDRDNTIEALSDALDDATASVDQGRERMVQAHAEILDLRTQLEMSRRALAVQVGRSEGLALSDVPKG